MITKELLSEMLGCEIRSIIVDKNMIKYYGEVHLINEPASINIYELAHKCKEWAFETDGIQIIHARKYGYGVGVVKYFSSIEVYNGHYLYDPSDELGTSTQVSFETETEPEAIFKACQWILDNRDK